MKPKIVAFSSSPRRNGNSDILADRILEGAREGGADVEKVRLHGLSIKPCAACQTAGEVKGNRLAMDAALALGRKLAIYRSG